MAPFLQEESTSFRPTAKGHVGAAVRRPPPGRSAKHSRNRQEANSHRSGGRRQHPIIAFNPGGMQQSASYRLLLYATNKRAKGGTSIAHHTVSPTGRGGASVGGCPTGRGDSLRETLRYLWRGPRA